jgi:hypothetical protein
MKRILLLSTVAALSAAFIFTSCGPSRVYASKEKTYRNPAPPPPPRYYNSVSLIVSPTPGFVMKQTPDGRFYHHSPQGYTYWKGNDNRFYLDRSYISRVSYNKWEYNEWKRYSRGRR